MSRFNTLYLGEAIAAAQELEVGDDETYVESISDVRVALINALRRIDQLERQVANLQKDLSE